MPNSSEEGSEAQEKVPPRGEPAPVAEAEMRRYRAKALKMAVKRAAGKGYLSDLDVVRLARFFTDYIMGEGYVGE